MPGHDNVKKDLWNISVHEFYEEPRVDQPIEGFAGIQKGAVNATPIFDVVVYCLLETIQCINCRPLLLEAKLMK